MGVCALEDVPQRRALISRSRRRWSLVDMEQEHCTQILTRKGALDLLGDEVGKHHQLSNRRRPCATDLAV